ncbi:(d)CMP kinase [Desulfonatronovibrio hydrogenovorans]|uniref:(d)CMP kinase n=1 Tax=Desulfonatronovibrio hydrogenovorans TaxID=53245 RepID=UPI00048F9146|nr:(d)CMP kinase [Desulfonatronovibrio hydrogenovorans]
MKDRPLLITIDGPAGVGKTTLARTIAQDLGIAYLDTGAMFRAVGLNLGSCLAELDHGQIMDQLEKMRFDLEGAGQDSRVILNNIPLGSEIRTEQVGMWASDVGKVQAVRDYLKESQQRIGQLRSLVAEGRDMGSVVFPQARHKFFLDAAPKIRAQRRVEQLHRMGEKADFSQILNQILKRDEQDRNRAIAPLKPAPEAIIIDTGHLDQEEVFSEMKKVLARSGQP